MSEGEPRWDGAYARDEPPPWDIGRPQPVFIELARAAKLRGRLLDSGCGTGENALLAAEHGADVVGIDLSPRAIATARRKAAARGLTATFEAADILEVPLTNAAFDTVIDSGLFHVFDDPGRMRYVAKLARVTRPGGFCYLMCFSDRQPGDWGPRRVRREEIEDAFKDEWDVVIDPREFDINPGLPTPTVQAWFVTLQRTDG